jgi:hypothetical protein
LTHDRAPPPSFLARGALRQSSISRSCKAHHSRSRGSRSARGLNGHPPPLWRSLEAPGQRRASVSSPAFITTPRPPPGHRSGDADTRNSVGRARPPSRLLSIAGSRRKVDPDGSSGTVSKSAARVDLPRTARANSSSPAQIGAPPGAISLAKPRLRQWRAPTEPVQTCYCPSPIQEVTI